MPRWIEPKVSVGNIITLLGMLVATAMAWSAMGANVEQARASVAQLKTESIPKLEERDRQLGAQIEVLREQASTERVRQTEILTELRTDIRYMRQTLDNLGAPARPRQ